MIPGDDSARSFEREKKATGKLGLPRRLARFPLLGGAGNCLETITDASRRLCDRTHGGFIHERFLPNVTPRRMRAGA